MRRIHLFFLLFLFASFQGIAASYEVRVHSSLNVRAEPGAFSQVIGTLQNGDTIEVLGLADGWARIEYNGQIAYVTEQFLVPVGQMNSAEGMSLISPVSKDRESVLYVILILSGILFVLRRIRKGNSGTPRWLLGAMSGIFLLVCVLEVYYLFNLRDFLWFCSPDQVGWLWTIINALIFAVLLLNQYYGFAEILKDIQSYSAPVDYRTGIYSYIGAVVLFIAGQLFLPGYTEWIVTAFLAAQLIQVAIIVYCQRRLPLYMLMSIVVYLVGSAATALIMFHFLAILIVVLIVWLALWIISTVNSNVIVIRR